MDREALSNHCYPAQSRARLARLLLPAFPCQLGLWALLVFFPALSWAAPPLWAQRVELGLFGGILLTPDEHELYDPGERTHRPLGDIAAGWGLRLSYLPISYAGVEVEGMLLPAAPVAGRDAALVYAARAQLLLQYPWLVTPFLLGGGGVLGVSSDDERSLGNDIDAAGHWGGGLKVEITPWVHLRVDARHILSRGLGAQKTAHYADVLGTVAFVLRGSDRRHSDADGDGVLDRADACPEVRGTANGCPDRDGDGVPDGSDACPAMRGGGRPDGCPDRDRDGVVDLVDRCVDEPGTAELQGCPAPKDSDGDGVDDSRDGCPKSPGAIPTGCPLDPDLDGLLGANDRCPDEPETKNGFEDDDGCPDELPKTVEAFTGTIRGITFELNRAQINPSAYATLDEAARVLEQYRELKVTIIGHTDASGSAARNLRLSQERAQAVLDYLVGKGIDAGRLEAIGAGSQYPIAENDTAEGRAQNRRIEFRLR